ncbi:uncharacterized protein LOC133893629 isoform X2 [Phragmites australis]|uniref:uncharacterized protein LOC133893629 isoform X2 n=1 Tax=Phragmites australis TaxID=29695 RepID=UPI002D777FB3|nr:uncharacterized protein LOC133893629 isoform X2 [Phragmites australis]
MGSNCCIAAKETPQPCMAPVEVSAYRIRHSPSWSFRWDNRTHIEDIMENNVVFSNHSSGNIQPEVKSDFIPPTEGHTSGDSLSHVFRRVKWQKSDKKMEASKLSKVDPRDRSTTNNSPPEESSRKSLDMVTVASDIKTSKSPPSTLPPVSKADPEDPSSSMIHSIRMDSISTRKARQSPEHQLYRQISDGNIPSLKSFSENSSAERRPSNSMLSACSNDLLAGRSQGESSDGCSTCTPSELVATAQRDSWSVDNDLFGSIASKVSKSNHTALSPNLEVCKLCSKLLKERSSWNGHELAVAAVLFCGHAYHANCLDIITAESEKYDPPCPVCTHGETCTAKLFGKLEPKIKNKTSNMADSDLDQSSKHQKKSTREPRLGTSSSMKDSLSRPFLRRHFSTGSRPPRPLLGSEPTRKKGFWSRHWRE